MNDLAARIRDVRFTPVRLHEAYDMGEVDYLLDRLLAAVEGDGDVLEILDHVALSEVRLREGYDIAEVDAFLADVRAAVSAASTTASAAAPNLDVVREIRDVRFTTRHIRPGYAMHEVDRLLDELEEAAQRGDDLTELLGTRTFTVDSWRNVYDQDEVDSFLSKLRDRAFAAGPAEQPPSGPDPGFLEVQAPPPAPPRPAAPPLPKVIVEQRGFLARLFGRR